MNTNSAIDAKFSARRLLAILAILAVTGVGLGWNLGKLPHPEIPSGVAGNQSTTAADLQLYREVIAEVRGGGNYYAVAREKLPQFGFPIASPFNWRLPTYAWVLSRLPSNFWIQAVLLALAAAGMVLSFVAARKQSGTGIALLTTLLLFGVVRWTFDGEAYLAQEVWASVLMLISVSAHALGRSQETKRTSVPFLVLSITAGTAALLFRELALPYCLIAYTLSIASRRWLEAAGWGTGLVAFGLLLGWHIGQVQGQLAGVAAGSAGISQWLRFGGLDFVLLTTRMNSLLFAAPAALLWLYLLAALVGLARRSDATSRLCCLSALAYLLAFAVVGRPENFYWGLLAAPFFPWGVAQTPQAIVALWKTASLSASALPAEIDPTPGAAAAQTGAAHQ